MYDQLKRTEILIGSENIKKLQESKVAIFGVGGVGGYVAEALVRCGIGSFDLIDNDTVSVSNINRQIIALNSTIGKYKVDVLKERMLDINPNAKISTYKKFYLPKDSSEFKFEEYSYMVDAIDTITSKIDLVIQAKKNKVPIISSMGAGNKLNILDFEVADIYNTSICPLAKVMRKELRKNGIDSLKVVYSKEEPKKGLTNDNEEGHKKAIPGSISFVPSAVGLIIASEVVKDICKS